ncbi:MAG: GMC family oxidoreductase [Candidatus Nanopelagicales bacterium]|nr:GMC family oxidoreductase [Candidatus Nanopelagicales bacterium]MDZ4249885.1 GMC family oxidoreductase [Candidatus Nanopelagicales bacterium]
MDSFDFDAVVIGSGFGGSVAALRLTEKGYRVGMLEAGRRFDDYSFPKTSWRLRKFLWAPRLGMTGIQRMHFLRNVIILAGAGVGGGSLVYANTLYVPPKRFFDDPQWSGITDWSTELAPYYDQAARMLGVVENPHMTPADEIMKAVADEMGAGHTFRMAPVGVFFGDGPGVKSPDPFFGGAGPERNGCRECGSCMTGCPNNAKNTLAKNYIWLAENAGAEVFPMTTVRAIRPLPGGGFAVESERTGILPKRGRREFSAEHVVFAAGTFNTQKLLHRMKDEGHLHALSPALGELSRTNSESLLGAISRDRRRDFTRGVAITSSFFPEPHTHIEPVRYGKGSNMMGLLGTVMTDEEPGVPRWKTWVKTVAKRPRDFVGLYAGIRGWSERSVIALCMQPVDNSLTVYSKKTRSGRWKLTSKQGMGEPSPSWIPAANDAVRRMAARVDGIPGGNFGEVISAPLTAHFIGGAPISESPETGVIDPYHRAWGYDGLHVVDGAAVTANLGVNPSLTITAQAERAFAMWPNRGEADPRPEQGEPYRRVDPVPPNSPAVPASAPGALRLPVAESTSQP